MSPVELLQAEAANGSVRLARDHEVKIVNGSERRAHTRRSVGDLDWLRLVRLTGGTGFSATLIDLSEGGALIEVDGPLRPGSRLTLELSGTGIEETVPLEVLRSYIASLRDGSARYRGACIFGHQIVLPAPGANVKRPDGFVGAEAALSYLLDRCGGSAPPAGAADGPRVTLERAQLLHVLESIYARGSKDLSDPGTRFVVELLGAILPPMQSGASRNDVMASLESRMSAWPSSLQTRLQATRIRLASLIDRCSLVAPGAPAQFAAPASPVESPAIEATPSEELPEKTTFQKIVVRYLDGGISKGFTQDFHPSRAHFSLWPAINAKPSERMIVPLANLKAIFFVRNFNGSPSRQDRKTFGVPGQGRRLEVTFMDTEVILGTTLSYSPDAQGFFVNPADSSGNNTRIFVVSGAVRRVRFF
jgi:hypothetical protein